MRCLGLVFCIFLFSACDEQATGQSGVDMQPSKFQVVASNYPLYFFTSEIAGDVVDVLMPEFDGDPAMWVPGASDVAQLQNADLIVINGAGYESWLAFTSLDSSRLIDSTMDISHLLLPIDNGILHQHGPGGEHSHQGTAFTSWLNPKIAIEQARAITRGLSNISPDQKEGFNSRLAVLEDRLIELDHAFEQAFESMGDQPLMFSHPVYQYLQNRYRLNAQSVHWEPDTEPGVKQWLEFQNLLREHDAELMIWEGQPLPSMVERLKKQGVRSIVFNPAANRPVSGDYFTVMGVNLAGLSVVD